MKFTGAATLWFLIVTTHDIPTAQHEEQALGPFETEETCQNIADYRMDVIEKQFILKLNKEIDTVYGCVNGHGLKSFVENLHKPKHDEANF